MSLDQITEGLIARQTPEAQAIIRVLLAQIAELKAEVARLKKSPQNSSLPREHAASARQTAGWQAEIQEQTRRPTGP